MSIPDVEYRTGDLRKITEFSERICSAERDTTPSTLHSYCATEVFHKLARHLDSSVKLLPNDSSRVVDVSAFACLARVVIECREALIYFTQRGVPKTEREFRVKLFQFHMK